MNTGVLHAEGNKYPGVYLSGEDALALAEWLKASADKRREIERLGGGPLHLLPVLEACYRDKEAA